MKIQILISPETKTRLNRPVETTAGPCHHSRAFLTLTSMSSRSDLYCANLRYMVRACRGQVPAIWSNEMKDSKVETDSCNLTIAPSHIDESDHRRRWRKTVNRFRVLGRGLDDSLDNAGVKRDKP